MNRIDLNADAGEGIVPGIDEALMPLLSSVSIACGGHAGDEESMRRVCSLAVEHGVRVGAHPSYPDRAGFGRTSISMPFEELVESLRSQIDSLKAAAAKAGAKVAYVKPHGALYNDSAADPAVAQAVTSAAGFLPVMLLATDPAADIREGFIDRTYLPDGNLMPRGEPGSLITGPGEAAAQALEIAPKVDSLCVHSDTPGALELLTAARRALEEAGFTIGTGA